MNSKYILLMLMAFLMMGCEKQESTEITNPSDYNDYLTLQDNSALQNAEENLKFWNDKLEQQPNQFPYLAKLASANTRLFDLTGNIDFLKNAEQYYVEVNEKTNYQTPGYLHGLARNYISQHKFKEALDMLTKAELIGDKLVATQKMLFDVHLELGNYQLAKTYLSKFENFSDFDYLIRLSKLSDHNGDLDSAIDYMERATAKAESSNLKNMKSWSYSNIADFYGHAGNIQASYDHYLKALEINPSDAYSKKGIAWIVYSHEKNPEEALRILNTVTKDYSAPDYHLLKAEIAEYMGNDALQEEEMDAYQSVVKNEAYGDMYNKYNVLLYSEDKNRMEDAIRIAQTEVTNRPTPQSYDLLAWAHFKNGNLDEALSIVETQIIDKTYEPETLYHVAEIYKAAGEEDKVKPLKKELVASIYELGPTMESKINQL